MKVEADLRNIFNAAPVEQEMREGSVFDVIKERLDSPEFQERINEVEDFAAWSEANLPTTPLK